MFRSYDVNRGLPYPDRSFDICHMRLARLGVSHDDARSGLRGTHQARTPDQQSIQATDGCRSSPEKRRHPHPLGRNISPANLSRSRLATRNITRIALSRSACISRRDQVESVTEAKVSW